MTGDEIGTFTFREQICPLPLFTPSQGALTPFPCAFLGDFVERGGGSDLRRGFDGDDGANNLGCEVVDGFEYGRVIGAGGDSLESSGPVGNEELEVEGYIGPANACFMVREEGPETEGGS